jgi:hypothetical protein
MTLSYIAVQYAGIADNDLLYFSYTNQVTIATHQHQQRKLSRLALPGTPGAAPD